MTHWYIALSTTYRDGDGTETFIVEAETAGRALDHATGTLNKDHGGGLIGWTASVSRVEATYERAT